MTHHHHLLFLAKLALAAGAAVATSRLQHPGNGLAAPLPVVKAHPIVVAAK